MMQSGLKIGEPSAPALAMVIWDSGGSPAVMVVLILLITKLSQDYFSSILLLS